MLIDKSPLTLLISRNALPWSILTAVIVAYTALLYSDLFGARFAVWLPYVGWALLSLAAGGRALLSAKRSVDRSGKLAWRFIGIAALAWCAGILYLVYGILNDPDFDPSPTLANFLFMGYGLLYLCGLYYLRSRRFPMSRAIVRMGNLGVIASAVVLCAVVVMLEPLLRTEETRLFIVYAVLDPAVFVTATIVTLTYLWMENLGALRPVVRLLFISIAIHAASNLMYFHLILSAGTSGSDIDVFWMVAFAFQYLAAVRYDQQSTHASREEDASPSLADSALQPVMPSLIILATLVILFIFRGNLSPVIVLTAIPLMAVFAVFLGIREWAIDQHASRVFSDLQKSHALNAHVLSVSPAVIFVAEAVAPYRISFLSDNADAQFGLAKNAYTLADIIHPDDASFRREELKKVLKYGVAASEFRFRNSADEYRWVDQRLILVRNEDQTPKEIIGSIMDKTEMKAMEKKMLDNQRLESLGQFSGSIAHDFNNLLTSVTGFSELLLASDGLSPEQRENIEEINAAGERGANLTRQLLAFSRRHTLAATVIELNKAIQNMTGMLNQLIGDRVSIDVSYSPNPVYVKADTGQLEQVIMNLVINARDATQPDGEIVIALTECALEEHAETEIGLDSGDFALISVKDAGTGMDEEVVDKIFEPFFTTKKTGQGTGLGLATVQSIVQQFGGHVTVRSRPDVGTEFSVFIPITDEELPDESNQARTGAPTGGEVILVVDDEPAITRVVANMLKPLGYSIFTAHDATTAEEIARQHKFDLLLTDVVMPGCNGRELEQRLRTIHPVFEVIFMSGYTAEILTKQQLAEDGATLLQKPLSGSDLARIIRETLDSQVTDHDSVRA